MREGSPGRVHVIELFLDGEIEDALCKEYHLLDGLSADDPFFPLKRRVALHSFLGYDYVCASLDDLNMPFNFVTAADSAELRREGGRAFMEQHRGPIASWEEFAAYPWPDVASLTTRSLEWYEQNLPDGMCVIVMGGFAHFGEYLTWLMGYETLCIALCEQRDLVSAISNRLLEMSCAMLERTLPFERVKIVWGSDDMGFKTGTLLSPDDLREFVLSSHKVIADMSHKAGRPYIIHSCGNLDLIMDDLIDDVKIDAKHSFEDVIEPVTKAKVRFGDRIGLLGGIDVDFLCRASEDEVRQRVRDTLDICMPGGGYCLGTGNSVANYIPLDNYLAMLDEGRRYSV
jgi:uroporphyrinogen decarboxylase